jgi:hypothetical protein
MVSYPVLVSIDSDIYEVSFIWYKNPLKTVPGAHTDDGHQIVSLILRNQDIMFSDLQVHTIMSPTIPTLP